MPLGLPMLAWVPVIYTAIQTVEGFVIAPLIRKGSVNLAPAWTLFAILIFVATFGAMSTGRTRVGRRSPRVRRFYIEDWLHDRASASAGE